MQAFLEQTPFSQPVNHWKNSFATNEKRYLIHVKLETGATTWSCTHQALLLGLLRSALLQMTTPETIPQTPWTSGERDSPAAPCVFAHKIVILQVLGWGLNLTHSPTYLHIADGSLKVVMIKDEYSAFGYYIFTCIMDWSFIKVETYAIHENATHLYIRGGREKWESLSSIDVEVRTLETGVGWGWSTSSWSPSFWKWEEDWDPEGEGGFPLGTWGSGWIYVNPQLLAMQTNQISWFSIVDREAQSPGSENTWPQWVRFIFRLPCAVFSSVITWSPLFLFLLDFKTKNIGILEERLHIPLKKNKYTTWKKRNEGLRYSERPYSEVPGLD